MAQKRCALFLETRLKSKTWPTYPKLLARELMTMKDVRAAKNGMSRLINGSGTIDLDAPAWLSVDHVWCTDCILDRLKKEHSDFESSGLEPDTFIIWKESLAMGVDLGPKLFKIELSNTVRGISRTSEAGRGQRTEVDTAFFTTKDRTFGFGEFLGRQALFESSQGAFAVVASTLGQARGLRTGHATAKEVGAHFLGPTARRRHAVVRISTATRSAEGQHRDGENGAEDSGCSRCHAP